MISVSLCMIVKNESCVLDRCLTSYSGLFDEIIIVDTGSTDNTIEIASKYTDKIFTYQWKDDFADARNYSFSKASCDYIFTADADEVLDESNRQAFLELKSMLLPEIDIVQMKYVNVSDFNTVYNSKKELRPKLFKRLRTFLWVNPIHETVRLSPVVYDSNIEILHMPVKSHNKRDFHTFINAFNKNIPLDSYVIVMFCKESWISGKKEDYQTLLPVFLQYIEQYNQENGGLSCYKEINCCLARMHRILGNKDSFFKIALKETALEPSSEICLELGNYYMDNKDYGEAVLWFINAYSETKPILDIHAGGDEPLKALSECYKKMSREKHSNGDYALAGTYDNLSRQYKVQAESWKLPEEI